MSELWRCCDREYRGVERCPECGRKAFWELTFPQQISVRPFAQEVQVGDKVLMWPDTLTSTRVPGEVTKVSRGWALVQFVVSSKWFPLTTVAKCTLSAE